MNLIVAKNKNNGIGRNNLLLYWIKRDLKRFKSLTIGNVVIMGYKTFETLPNGPLKDRINIVISRNEHESVNGEIYVKSIEEAVNESKKYDGLETFVIGGAEIYKQFIEQGLVDKMYITEIDDDKQKANKFFPTINYDLWEKINEEEFFEDNVKFKFIDYIKK